MKGPDWLVAIDAAMRNEPRTCTACGRRADVLMFNVWVVGKLALPVARCPNCRRGDPESARVQDVMQARYGTDPRGRPSSDHGEHQSV
jgi:hypothetical protein